MGYSLLEDGGSYGSGDKHLDIRLYANDSSIESRLTSYVQNGFSSVLSQAVNANEINSYEIWLCNEYFNLSFTDKGDYLSKFSDECKARGYDVYNGVHLGAATGMNGGVAYTGSGYSSFKQDTYAVFNCDGTPKEAEKNVAIQEAFHGAIDASLVSSTNSSEGEGDQDHDLGQVYSDGSVSPMATGYTGSHARHGDCSPSNAYFGFYKAKLTNCAENALGASATEYDT